MHPCLRLHLCLQGWSFHERLLHPFLLTNADGSLVEWRKKIAPHDPFDFEKRLLWDGLTREQAATALSPNSQDVPDQPAWLPLLEQLCEAPRQSLAPDPLENRGSSLAFVHVWRPVARWALDLLQTRCAPLFPCHLVQEEAWLDLAEALLERLCATTDQALYALFEQRRTPGQMLLAHLGRSGDGSDGPIHEAYDDFVSDLHSSGYGDLLEPFPVLGRLLANVTQLWLESSEEMLCRLAISRAALAEQFSIPLTAPLQSVQLGLSDPHRGGRVVMILRLGTERDGDKIVYKPKDVRVDCAYQQVLQHLNEASSLPHFRVLKVVDCGGYGFMEWVDHHLCKKDGELAEFYVNAGRIMALLFLLGCSDCHHENLIASGHQLLLIDTETLLEPELRDLVSQDADNPEFNSTLQASIHASVLRTGLLPQWFLADGRRPAVDISALGIQLPPRQVDQPVWLGLNSDGMMPGHELRPSTLPTSLPFDHDNEHKLADFLEELCAGFVAQLREAIRLRPLLLNALESFRGLPRRLVARPTRLYFVLQRQMLQPGALRSAVAQGLLLEQLSRSFLLAKEKPFNWPLFAAEVRQMQQLDIPFFEHLIDGEDLPLPEGLPTIHGMIINSGLASAIQRLKALDQAEINLQEQLVRGAISTRLITTIPAVIAPPSGKEEQVGSLINSQAMPAAEYQEEAIRLAEQLWDAAIFDRQGRPEWLGLDLEADGESFNFGLIGASLFSGTSGIALALARLVLDGGGDVSAHWRELVWPCLHALNDLTRSADTSDLFRLMRDLSFGLVGSGGLLLALHLLRQAGYREAGVLSGLLLEQIRPEHLLSDPSLDIIGGVAGMIGPLLLYDQPRALELAVICGERLLSLQLKDGGWLNGQTRRPLSGFSHGAAGMAASLSRLARESGESRFADAAWRAVQYERSVYVPEQANWPDFRRSREANDFMCTWCHGAPGILLSRLVLQKHGLMDENTGEEMHAARATTLHFLETMADPTRSAANLCCGLFGLTSLLRLDAQIHGQDSPPVIFSVEAQAIQSARSGIDYTFFPVDRGSLSLPGLFTGRAGVVLALQEASTGMRWLGPIMSAGLLIHDLR